VGVASTPAQLSFPEIGVKPRKKTDLLFLALFPESAAARKISKLAKRLRIDYSIRYPATPVERLHVSLYHIGDFFGVPQSILDRVRAAADAVDVPPFQAAFDRASSFERKHGRQPLVLRASGNALPALAALYSALATGLAKQKFEVFPAEFFVPHVTMLRDEQNIDEPVDTISWIVHEFVLVHRKLEGFDYELIHRWPLRG